MTVLQSQHPPQYCRGETSLPLLCRSYVEAVSAGSPFAHRLGLDLAEAVLALETSERGAVAS